MELTLAERRVVMDYLPAKEDYKGLKEIRKARENLAWTGEELMEANKHTQDTGDGKRIYEPAYMESVVVDIPLTEWVTELIRDILRDKAKKHELMEKDFTPYEKFIVDYDQV